MKTGAGASGVKRQLQLNKSIDKDKSLQILEPPQTASRPQAPAPLMVKYNNLKRAIARLADFTESEKFKEINCFECKLREERMETQWKGLEDLHFEVLLKYDDAEDTAQNEFDLLEDRYFKASAALKKKIMELNPNVQTAGANQ